MYKSMNVLSYCNVLRLFVYKISEIQRINLKSNRKNKNLASYLNLTLVVYYKQKLPIWVVTLNRAFGEGTVTF